MSEDDAKANAGYRAAVDNLIYFKLLALNFSNLATNGFDNSKAFVIAALRCRWYILGCLKPVEANKRGLEQEHRVYAITAEDNAMNKIMNATTLDEVLAAFSDNGAGLRAQIESADHGSKWITKHAENIWAAVECVVRLRSHHMKTTGSEAASYNSLYTRIMNAAYEGNFVLPPSVDWLAIARTAIHPFMIESLPIMTSKFIAYRKVSASTVLRLSGGPCGCAQVTTAAAALDTMTGEVWFGKFNEAYGSHVGIAIEAKNVILNNKYSYHIASKLYGLEKVTAITIGDKTHQISDVISMIQNVSSACQGLINAMESAVEQNMISTFALANAKALQKAASAAPLMALRVKAVVEMSIDAINDAETMEAAIKAAFPDSVE
jgi:hypothetical protein